MTHDDRLIDLFRDEATPIPPGLRTPPIAAIRGRARRARARALTLVTIAVAALVVLVLIAPRPWLAADPAEEPPGSAGVGVGLTWAMARVSADQRTLSIGVVHPEPPPTCGAGGLSARAVERPTYVAVIVTWSESGISCRHGVPPTIVPVTLRDPLGGRDLLDGADARARPHFPASLIPVPTHPAGLMAEEAFATGDDGPAFVRSYGGVGGPDVSFQVTGQVPDTGGDRIAVHGRDASIRSFPERGRGHGYRIVWSAGSWWVAMTVGWAPWQDGTRAELQAVIDGLRWDSS